MKFRSCNPLLTTNIAGGTAFKQSDEYAFVCLLLTTFLKAKFYETANSQVERIRTYAQTLDPIFVLKAAYYARNVHGIRSATHIVAAELVDRLKGTDEAYKQLALLVKRPDDLLEIVSYYKLTRGPKRLPALLRKMAKYALTFFDEYQIAKYKSSKSQFKMVDLFNVIHPKPDELRKSTYKKLIKEGLPQTDTWEAQISACGNNDVLKQEVWTNLVRSRKLGYFALLRNLRNILTYAPNVIEETATFLRDANAIKKSLILPFRFMTAASAIDNIPGSNDRIILQAISDAVDISLDNLPTFKGNTLIAIDASGSMHGDKPDAPLNIACLFAACLFKKNNADIMLFDTKSAFVNNIPPVPTLTLAQILINAASQHFCGATAFSSIFTTNIPYDRIIILSDMQSWRGDTMTSYRKYSGIIGKAPILHGLDLAGHSTMQFPQKNVYTYAGFSGKVLDIMKLVEQKPDALLLEIKKINLVR